MIWKQTGTNILKSGEWVIVRFPWKQREPSYILWRGDEYFGRYKSSDEAKNACNI